MPTRPVREGRCVSGEFLDPSSLGKGPIGRARCARLPSGRVNAPECSSVLALAFASSRIRYRGSPSDDGPWNVVPDSVDVVRINEGRNKRTI